MQLRQKIFWMLLAMAVAPLFVLLAQLVSYIKQDIEERTAQEIHKTLDKMSKEIRNEMGNQKSIADGLAKVPIVKEFAAVQEGKRRSAQYETKATQLALFFLNYQSTTPSIQALRFTDTRGRTLVKVKEGALLPVRYRSKKGLGIVEDIHHKDFFMRALKTEGRTSVSNYERGKVTGEVNFCPAMVRYSVPIRDELDSLQGFLVVNMWGKRIDNTVEAALGGIPGNVYIVEINPQNRERDGIYLYHKDPDKRFANQLGTGIRFSNRVGQKAWQKISRTASHGEFPAADGSVLYFKVHKPYDDRDTKWLLVIDVPKLTALASINKIRDTIGLLILLVLVASLFVARWAAARLAQPVQKMAQLMTRYADGEKQLRYEQKRSDEVEHLGQAFNYLTDKLEKALADRMKAEAAARQSERLAAIGQMAAGIGHEINNPLMNINSLAKLIEQDIPEKETQTRSDLQALRKEVKRCARIVQGILNFAREAEPQYVEFDIVKLLGDTVLLFERRGQQLGVSFSLDRKSPLFVHGDPNQLQQVFVNILLNALHAVRQNGKVAIHVIEQQEHVVVRVLDDGVGIREQDLPQIFNPFFSTKDEGEGTGLGLSVSYGIVKKHQGNIQVSNRPEGGVKVEVVLPRADELPTEERMLN